MAKIISGSATKPTRGERRFAERLEELLEDDYLCWFNVPIGRRNQYPDFIILHPRRGVLVIEVKDWRIDTIQSITPASVTLLTPSGLKHASHPLDQARQYAFQIKEVLERDPLLQTPPGLPYQGRLVLPYGYGLVLSEITRQQFESTDLHEAINPRLVICKDEMSAGLDAEQFQKRLWNMFTTRFDTVLTLPQVDRIRWHLFPEIRVAQRDLFAPEHVDAANAGDVLMRVMDLQQEQLARSLGEGHRVIHGVAGSGKTLILGYRCERLAQTFDKPILVLCFNVVLAAKLNHMIAERGLSERVSVRHFHGWCGDQLDLYHVMKPAPGEQYPERLATAVTAAVERGQIPRAQYGAVLIDEGHDFEPEWLTLVTQMIDPASNSLLLLYDDAQSIYGAARARKFSFKAVGIQAQGRTTILRVNYRNTNEILRFAYEFAHDVLQPKEAGEDGIPLVKPEMAGRHGPEPQLLHASSVKDEARCLSEHLRGLHVQGTAWKDMAVLYPAKFICDEILSAFDTARIPYEWLQRNSAARRYDAAADSVKIMTMHSSKGLEFPVVAIAGIGHLPIEDEHRARNARLLYVAMTRATERLVMTASRGSEFVERMGRVAGVA